MTDTVILCHVCGKPSRSGATHAACLPSPHAWGVVNRTVDVEPNPLTTATYPPLVVVNSCKTCGAMDGQAHHRKCPNREEAAK